MEEIVSTRNPQVQALKKLSRARERREAGLFLVEGPRMAGEAVQAGLCEGLYISRSEGRILDIANTAAEKGCKVTRVSEVVMDSLCESKTPQGILCVCHLPREVALPEGRYLLALDAVQNPGNVGTMIRTADAAGFAGVLLGAGCADPYSAKTLAATMGSIFRVPLAMVEDLAGTLTGYRERGYSVLASELGGEDFFEATLSVPAVLVIGNEGNGISEAVSREATRHVMLPMRGGAESLNASVAAGILMYDLSRRGKGEKEDA